MASVHIEMRDPVNAITLRSILQAAGHQVVGHELPAEVLFCDDPNRAAERASRQVTLMVTTAAGVHDAVQAMHRGTYGYILLPFQPGEAELMVARALAHRPLAGTSPEEDWKTLAQVEERHIRETLRRCHNNRARAARMLGIGRNTLWRKLREYENQ